MGVPDGISDEGVWFRVEAASAASAVRRAAERLAAQLDLGEQRTAALAIVAAELAGNLAKHAEEGVLLMRPTRRDDQAGVELIAIDAGPGMTDLAGASRQRAIEPCRVQHRAEEAARLPELLDGYSTSSASASCSRPETPSLR